MVAALCRAAAGMSTNKAVSAIASAAMTRLSPTVSTVPCFGDLRWKVIGRDWNVLLMIFTVYRLRMVPSGCSTKSVPGARRMVVSISARVKSRKPDRVRRIVSTAE